ncbi:MAG: DUF4339 domain-containing protein [Verrucomicrobiales bacterium]|nr:DUF4339 domain-containing protein [Verrucomicrobiales bacterium]
MDTNGWYYAVAGERKGPVTGAELTALAAAGTVTPETLVWREGMAGWAPYAQATAPSESVPPQAVAATVCAECGKSVAAADWVELSGRRICAACKPVVLQRLQEGVPSPAPESEAIRRAHLNHEASIKSWGVLQVLGGSLVTLVGLGMAVAMISGGLIGAAESLVVLGLLAYGGFLLWLGFGLRRLRNGARIGSAILAGIGLLGFPFGTLINGYVLYLLLSQKGRTIFSDAYRRVVAETPHIKYRTPVWLWILVGLVLLALVAAIGFGIRRG